MADVVTNDRNAISLDPRRSELWTKQVQRKHAQDTGWALESTLIIRDEDSVHLARGTCRQSNDTGPGGDSDMINPWVSACVGG